MSRFPVILALALVAGGCGAKSAPSNWAAINSGNPVLDKFLTAVRDRDEQAVTEVATFKQISRYYPQYKTAAEYFAFISDCALVSVSKTETNPDLYWARWSCSDGQYRQAFNTAYEAPKIMASEMLKPDSDQLREKAGG